MQMVNMVMVHCHDHEMRKGTCVRHYSHKQKLEPMPPYSRADVLRGGPYYSAVVSAGSYVVGSSRLAQLETCPFLSSPPHAELPRQKHPLLECIQMRGCVR